MDKLKIYLDNCCYGRPYDDLSQAKIKIEASAKMYIQSLIRFSSLELCSSFMLYSEINDSPFVISKDNTLNFVNEYSQYFVGEKRRSDIEPIANEIMGTGVKYKDAVHLACSIIAKCDYFITTDNRVLNYKTDKIKIVNPVKFVDVWEEI